MAGFLSDKTLNQVFNLIVALFVIMLIWPVIPKVGLADTMRVQMGQARRRGREKIGSPQSGIIVDLLALYNQLLSPAPV